MTKITVYTKSKTPRLTYILEVFFKLHFGVNFILTDDTTLFEASEVKINYSTVAFKNCLSIVPEGLLTATNITAKDIRVFWQDNIPYFFKTASENSFNYDIFSAAFFLLSRYEEYLPSIKDTHQRFRAENSLAYKNNFLHLPVIEIWADQLKKKLLEKHPSIKFSQRKFQHINTIDIDFAYAYKGRPFVRNLASLLKNIFKFDTLEIKNKIAFFTGKTEDPFDTYHHITKLSKKHSIRTVYFFLLGNYGRFDKSHPPKSLVLKHLIQMLQKENLIGIHPSYKSNTNFDLLTQEIIQLEKITKNKTTQSRQHFLKMTLPETYDQLLKNGITDDYTMGYASQIGFRAGTCTPFPFFNLATNQKTTLTIHPFQVMDMTLKKYLQLSPEQATEAIEKIIDQVKSVNGTFTSLWHNSSLTSSEDWKGWLRVYENIFEKTAC